MRLSLATLLTCLLALAGFSAAAHATTKCQCDNGVIVHTADDDANACEEACKGMGGGEEWSDDEDDDDTTVVVPPRKDPAPRPRR